MPTHDHTLDQDDSTDCILQSAESIRFEPESGLGCPVLEIEIGPYTLQPADEGLRSEAGVLDLPVIHTNTTGRSLTGQSDGTSTHRTNRTRIALKHESGLLPFGGNQVNPVLILQDEAGSLEVRNAPQKW